MQQPDIRNAKLIKSATLKFPDMELVLESSLGFSVEDLRQIKSVLGGGG